MDYVKVENEHLIPHLKKNKTLRSQTYNTQNVAQNKL